jgi:hypothetical protein
MRGFGVTRDRLGMNGIALLIIAGEGAFWMLILMGLIVRYVLHRKRASAVLLSSVPVIDLVVLVATTFDLANGGKANFSHGLAAVYLGFSIVFGPSMVRWADVHFAHRFAGGPPPPPNPQGRAKVAHGWRQWGKCVSSCAIAAVLLLLAIFVIREPEQVKSLWDWLPRLGGTVVVWFLFGPLWTTLSGRGRDPGPRSWEATEYARSGARQNTG